MSGSEKNLLSILRKRRGFSLPEVMAALTILAIISSSTIVVINRCMESVADSALRMQALEVARENMETLLAKDSVKDGVEYGICDKHPAIQWQTTVEPFYESLSSQMWVRAICSAEYTDIKGQTQKIEITHWLTEMPKEQLLELVKQMGDVLAAEQLVETREEAAEYAEVDMKTVAQWEANGMPKTTPEVFYMKNYLDLYKKYSGNPPPDAINKVAEDYYKQKKPQEPGPDGQGQTPPGPDDEGTVKPPGPDDEGTVNPPPEGTKEENPFGLPDGWEDLPIEELIPYLLKGR